MDKYPIVGPSKTVLKCRQDLHAVNFASACPEPVSRIFDAFGLNVLNGVWGLLGHGARLVVYESVSQSTLPYRAWSLSPPRNAIDEWSKLLAAALTIPLWRCRPAPA
jgi:hypothetical protein